jgi:hypothetical protein
MSSCNNQECDWFWIDKIPDVYVPAIEGKGVIQEHEDGYVDISLWRCGSCGGVKAEVD